MKPTTLKQSLLSRYDSFQGTYLGYFVGVLTNLERSFGITSEKAGLLISLHDVGHTVAVLLTGFFTRGRHLPRITAAGNMLFCFKLEF